MASTIQTPAAVGRHTGESKSRTEQHPTVLTLSRQENSMNQYPIRVRLDPKNKPQLMIDLFMIQHAIKRHSKDPARARLVAMLRKLWLTILREIGPEWSSYRHAWENRP
jgi:hypothetical protein